MKKISVYGGLGFIGKKFTSLFSDHVEIIERETREPRTNEILYLISTTHNYNIFDNPHLDINTNLTVLIETLEASRKKYGSDFIFNFVSSWFVYGKTKDLPAKEDSICNPTGFYSITKRTAEQILISYCETYNIKYRIFRLCNVYGPSDEKCSKKRNALQFMIQQVVLNKDINLYDNGENIRDFLFVDDVCRAIKLLLDSSKCNEIYNIGSGNPYKFIDIMNYVKNKTNSTSKFISVDPPEFHKLVQVQNMFLNVDKLKELNFIQEYDIWNGVDMIIENTLKGKNNE